MTPAKPGAVIAVLLLALVQWVVPGIAAGSSEGLGWETLRLDLEVQVLPADEQIKVRGILVIKLEAATSSGPTIFINSRVANMTFTKIEAENATSILLNEKLEGRPAVRLAAIRFEQPVKRGAELTVEFEYESKGGSSQFGVGENAAIGSWVDTWHPVPLLDPDSGVSLASASRSTGTMTLRLPPTWRGVTEGKLVSRKTTDNETIEVWDCVNPVARSFAAGQFTVATETVGDRVISVYRLKEKGIAPHRLARTIANILESLEARYGPYPYDSYSIIETPHNLGNFGAASLQGMIFARPHWFRFDTGSIPLFAHEMAHGWWGNLVGTRGPGSILCSESLAQYSAAIAIESNFGEQAATEFMRFSREDYIPIQCARGYFEIWRKGHDTEMSKLKSGGWFHNLSDSKGHWVFHMLRRRVGDEIFFETLRSLISEYAGKQMTLDNVRSAFIRAAPNGELDQFFRQWLDQKGAPVLKVEFEPKDDDNILVTIVQQQPGEPYHLQLDLELQYQDGRSTQQQLDVRKKEQQFEIAVDELPVGLMADPQHRLLLWTPEYGENPLTHTRLAAQSLSADQMQPYLGEYEIEGVGVMRISINDGQMMAEIPNEPASAFRHLSDHQFETNGFTVTFQLADGQATGFVAEKGSRKVVGKRKKP